MLSDPHRANRCPRSEEELEERLSEPDDHVIESLFWMPGDIVVLGVGGKMGPTLARMARRALDVLGRPERVFGVARFSDPAVERKLQNWGVETIRCDLLERAQVQSLPDAANVIYMAGQKFGTTQDPERAWAMNTLAPSLAAERYSGARIVAFSTGCVYPFAPVSSEGSRESDPLEPPGEYANSCVGRERILGWHARRHATPLAIVRLNYAIDLRYGVILDIARKVLQAEPIDLSVGYVNVIWQRDASAIAIRCLERASSPPFVVNVTGRDKLSVRELANRLGALLAREPVFRGRESDVSLLSNPSVAYDLFGPPAMPLERMLEWTAEWLQSGLPTWDRPTHYEATDGRF